MAHSMTPEEIRAEKIGAMGEVLGQLHYDLWNDVAWLYDKWQQFKQLYEASPERIGVLNRTAPAFFYLLQRILFDDILLHISRLTDRVSSFGHDNLTLLRLKDAVDNPEIQAEVVRLLEIVSERVTFVRKLRDRRIAHTDLLTARNLHPDPLPPATRRDVEGALEAIGAVMNCIEGHYQESEVLYEDCIETDDAETLIFFLERGIQALDEEPQRRKDNP